jgi:very-short-patch-repair endonuclease
MREYNPYLKNKSRELRKEMTETEIMPWNRLRRKQINGLQFYRQKPLGKYVVDFYCPKKKLVIEIDGGQHFWDENIKQDDKQRDKYLKNDLGLEVLRVTNVDVFQNIEGAVNAIFEALK